MERIDNTTGEVLSDGDDGGYDARNVVAADGGAVAKRSGHLADVLRMLEDGQFNADVSEQMRELAKKMEAFAHNNKGVAKGKLTVDLNFSVANGIFVITPEFKVKAPVEKRAGTALFLGENGSLGRNPVGQTALFGDRRPRDTFEDRETRDI